MTVQSTAHKNLLLQQTVKSILTCLREEARHNAEAAEAAHQQHTSTHGMAADTVAAAAAAAPHTQTQEAAWLGQPMQPHLQMQQQQDHDSPSTRANTHMAASLSTQQCDGDGSLSDAGADLQQLEARVAQLSGELLDAQRALAAALQAALPQDLQAACTINATQHSTAATAPAQGSILPGSPDGHFQPCAGPCPHSPGSRGSPTNAQARPRRLRNQQQEQQGTNRGSHVGHGGSGYCCCCGGVQPGPLEAALDDGVAAFVLHCVQQLRRGAAVSRQQTAGTGSLPGPSSRRVKQTASGAAFGSNSRSASPVTRGSTTGAACGAEGGSASSTAQAAQGMVVGGGRDAGGGVAAGGELLARLLLEQLHSYSRQHLSAYDGLSISFGQEGQQGPEGMQQAATASSSRQQQGAGGAAAVTAEGFGGVEQGGRLQWPAAPLPGSAAPGGVNPVAVCVPGDGAVSCCVGLEEGGTTLQLPALPSLLNNMGRTAPSQQLPQHAEPAAGVAAAAASSTGCRNRSPVRADRDGLFDAVLSELRPWGGAPLACSSASTAAPLSPRKTGPTSGTTAGLISRSRTPTSPAAVPKSDVFRCSPLSPNSRSSKGHTRTAGQF